MDVLVGKANGAGVARPCSPSPPQASQVCVALGRFKRHGEEKSAARLPALIFPSCKAEADHEPRFHPVRGPLRNARPFMFLC